MKRTVVVLFAAIVPCLLVGCGLTTGPTEIVGIAAEPAELNMLVGVSVPVSVVAVRSDGKRVAMPASLIKLVSSDEGVVRISPESGAIVVAAGVGDARIAVTLALTGRTMRTEIRAFVGTGL